MSSRLSALWLPGISGIALLFGLATIYSGGQILFGSEAARKGAGNYVPFVVWFNFIAGFAYVVAATGLARLRPWAARLSLAIAVATALAFVLFGWFVLNGTLFEPRTVAALTLRTLLWAGIAWVACRRLGGCTARRTIQPPTRPPPMPRFPQQ